MSAKIDLNNVWIRFEIGYWYEKQKTLQFFYLDYSLFKNNIIDIMRTWENFRDTWKIWNSRFVILPYEPNMMERQMKNSN